MFWRESRILVNRGGGKGTTNLEPIPQTFCLIHTGCAGANLNTNPLMLLVCSVNTPIHAHRFHLLCVALRPVWMRPQEGVLEWSNFLRVTQLPQRKSMICFLGRTHRYNEWTCICRPFHVLFIIVIVWTVQDPYPWASQSSLLIQYKHHHKPTITHTKCLPLKTNA